MCTGVGHSEGEQLPLPGVTVNSDQDLDFNGITPSTHDGRRRARPGSYPLSTGCSIPKPTHILKIQPSAGEQGAG